MSAEMIFLFAVFSPFWVPAFLVTLITLVMLPLFVIGFIAEIISGFSVDK